MVMFSIGSLNVTITEMLHSIQATLPDRPANRFESGHCQSQYHLPVQEQMFEPIDIRVPGYQVPHCMIASNAQTADHRVADQ